MYSQLLVCGPGIQDIDCRVDEHLRVETLVIFPNRLKKTNVDFKLSDLAQLFKRLKFFIETDAVELRFVG